MELRPETCIRAAEFVSLELDGELSLLERAILRRHVQRCERCAEYARDVIRTTELLRGARPERMGRPIDLPRVRRRALPRLVQTAGVAAAAAIAIWLGIPSSSVDRERAPFGATLSPSAAADDGRFDWPAGLPRTVQVVQLSPGGLYGPGVDS